MSKKFTLRLIIASFFCGSTLSNAQNLVQAGDFEGGLCTYPNPSNAMGPWFAPTTSTPDYLSSCNQNPSFSTPKNFNGYQVPRSGKAYYHLFVFAKNSKNSTQQREYISAPLTSSLKSGKKYCAEMYVNLANNSVLAIDEIGMLFTNGAPTCSGFSCLLSANPQVASPNGVPLQDTLNWVKVSGTFTATGGENTLTLGNFKTDLLTDTTRVKTGFGYSMYLIDDVSVRELPTASISGNTSICGGGSTVLTAGAGNLYTYAWSNGSISQSITVSPTITTTYSLVVSNGACANDTATVTVTVNPKPTASIAGNVIICAGSSTTLNASGGSSYSWSNGASTASISVSPTTTTAYTVNVSNGPCSDTATVTVSVNPMPVASITGNATICAGSATMLTANGGSGTFSYSWNNGSTSQSISVSPSATTTYTVLINAGSCNDTASFTVTVNALPSVILPLVSNICKGELVTLTASGNAASYSWSTGATGASISVSPTVTTTYTVSGTNGGCSSTAAITVILHSVSAAFTATPEKGPSALHVQFSNNSVNGVTYHWELGDGDTSNLFQPQHIYKNPGTYTIKLTVTNSYGCTDVYYSTVTVEDIPSLYVPNAFTPDGDGLNDLFAAKGVNIDPACFSMWIFDRWGNEIYRTGDLNEGWDGRAKDGKDIAQMDVYVWKISYRELDSLQPKKIIGHVSLIK